MGIVLAGFFSGTFASAAIELAQEVNPIVVLPDDPSDALLAIQKSLVQYSPASPADRDELGPDTVGFLMHPC